MKSKYNNPNSTNKTNGSICNNISNSVISGEFDVGSRNTFSRDSNGSKNSKDS